MSNYTRTTNFTAKDSLPTGNANKVVKGSEIQTELDNIATAVATKLDTSTASSTYAPLASPTLTGTPAAPTATAGTSTTQIATTAFVQSTAMSAALPNQTGNSGKIVTTNGTDASWGTYAVTNGALTQNTGKLLGRTTASSGAIEEITVSGATLNAGTLTITPPSAALGASLTLLAAITPTAAANVDALSTFTASYDNYLIMGVGLSPAADDALRFQLATAGAADTGSNYYSGSDDVGAVTSAAGTAILSGTATSAGKGASFVMHVCNVNDATRLKMVALQSISQSAATPAYTLTSRQTTYAAANTVSGIRFYWSSGNNFSAVGKIRIYGYNNT